MTPLRALGYTRTSTDEQLNRPDDDRARITAACQAYGYELVDVLCDPGFSGKVPLADRPHGARVQRLIDARGRNAEADVLIVTSLDRLTRDARGGTELVESLMPGTGRRRRHDPVTLLALDDHIDLASAHGRLTTRLRFLLGSFERELIAERTSHALQHRRRTGKVAGTVPYGWRREDDQLLPVAAEQDTLVAMQRHRDAGTNDTDIARLLNADGVPTKRGGQWTATTVYRILRAAEDMAS